MRTWTQSLVLLMLSSVLATAPAQEDDKPADKVFLKNGKVLQFEAVTKIAFDAVTFKMMGNQQRYTDVMKVDRFEFADAPSDYVAAEHQRLQGQFALALKSYERAEHKIKKGTIVKSYIAKQCIPYYKASCRINLARQTKDEDSARRQYRTAVKELEALLKDSPQTFFKGHALNGMVQCHIGTGNFEKAKATLTQLEPLGGPWRVNSKLQRAKIQEKGGEPQKAASLYRDVIRMSKEYPEQADQARLSLGYCLIALKEYPKAVKYFEDLVASIEPMYHVGENSVNLAKAYNGLGDARAASNDKEKLHQALVSYLRVVVLYSMDPEEHAKALYSAAKVLERLESRDWKKQSSRLYLQLSQTYPDSEWSRKER